MFLRGASGSRGAHSLALLVGLLARVTVVNCSKGFYKGYSPIDCKGEGTDEVECTSPGLGEDSNVEISGYVAGDAIAYNRDCALASENCQQVKCCHTPGYVCYEKNAHWAGCRSSCSPGSHPDDPWDYGNGSWTCKVLDGGVSAYYHPPNIIAPHDSPVTKHGHLSVKGNAIVDKYGNPVHLEGMSLFWSQWAEHYWNADVVKWLANDWGISLLRAAMGVEKGGHLVNPAAEEIKVRTVVKAAMEVGIYVLIDWHAHEMHRDRAKQFFDQMAREFGKIPNVMFETFNEPIEQSWAHELKPYHEAVAETIRRHSNNIIICGTRHWSQDVDEAAQNPVYHHKNIAYTLHFYAATHQEQLRDKGRFAMNKGVPIFLTEWGTCEASGTGRNDLNEARAWLGFAEHHKISHANWALNDKPETCSALKPGASPRGGWPTSQLTEAGFFVRNQIKREHNIPDACVPSGEDCRSAGCCGNPSETCFEKNQHWASCKSSCTPGVCHFDPPQYRTPWTCRTIGKHYASFFETPNTTSPLSNVVPTNFGITGFRGFMAATLCSSGLIALVFVVARVAMRSGTGRVAWRPSTRCEHETLL